MNIELYLDGLLNLAHIFLRKDASAFKEPQLANGRQLVRHGFTVFAFKDHQCFTGMEAIYLVGQRDDLNSIEELI
jgi:hypothetical protein